MKMQKNVLTAIAVCLNLFLILSVFAQDQARTSEPAGKIRSRIAAATKGKMELSEDGRTLLSVTDRERRFFTIPKGVTTIGANAFMECAQMKKVTIPDTVTSIGVSAFNGCASLKNITIPDSVTEIGACTFCGCGSLKKVVLPKGITEIAPMLFCENGGLERVTIPDGVTKIGFRAFFRCGRLKEVVIPASVTEIGKEAFSGVAVKVHPENPAYYTDSKGVLFDKKASTLLFAPKTLARRYVIPEGTASVEAGAFHHCGKNISVIEIPSSVTQIGDAAFEGVQTVEVAPGNSIFKLDKHGVLFDTVKKKILFAPPTLKGDYVVPDGIQYLGGKAFHNCKELTGVKLPEGLLEISHNVFAGCSKLREINLPDSIRHMGFAAFGCCVSLSKIKLPAGLTKIDAEVFNGCSKISEFEIPPKVTYIATLAFKDTAIKEIFIPDHVKEVVGSAFMGCPNLRRISLPAHIPKEDVEKWELRPACKVVWRKEKK